MIQKEIKIIVFKFLHSLSNDETCKQLTVFFGVSKNFSYSFDNKIERAAEYVIVLNSSSS